MVASVTYNDWAATGGIGFGNNVVELVNEAVNNGYVLYVKNVKALAKDVDPLEIATLAKPQFIPVFTVYVLLVRLVTVIPNLAFVLDAKVYIELLLYPQRWLIGR